MTNEELNASTAQAPDLEAVAGESATTPTLDEQLSNALASLRSANWQLKKDIEREREQEKQRVADFGATLAKVKEQLARLG